MRAQDDDLEAVFAALIERTEVQLMITLMRIELLKLRTAPAAWVALALTALLTVASVFSSVLLAGVQGAPTSARSAT